MSTACSPINERPNHYDVIVVDELAGQNGLTEVLCVGFFTYDGGRE